MTDRQLPEWALPLVDGIRNAVIETPGDVDCVAVLQAVLDGLGDAEIPRTAADFAGQVGLTKDLVMTYRIIIHCLAEELRDA
jgi:hypothetical protein